MAPAVSDGDDFPGDPPTMIAIPRPAPPALGDLLHTLLHDEKTRPLRFVVSGAPTASVQLGILALLVRFGWPVLAANGLAIAVAAQMSFALSVWFTWRGRNVGRRLARTWLMFHASICVTVMLNLGISTAGALILPLPVAAVAGVAAAAVGNFASGDRLIFRQKRGIAPAVVEPAAA